MSSKIQYTCIRCNYMTKEKFKMKRHFYSRKTECQGSANDIELTETIKEKILKNRIYHLIKAEPVNEQKFINQTINNNNTINNFVVSMDTMNKLNKIIEYKKIDLVGLEFSIENQYMREIKRLETDKYKYGFNLKKDDFLNIIDTITKVSENFKNLNVLYDTSMNKLKLYKGNWETVILDIGVKDLIQLIQDSYLYQYEIYLLKKIYGGIETNYREIAKYKESLEDYFKFISIFDVKPYCFEKMNCDILDNDDEEYSIEEKCRVEYDRIAIVKSEVNKTKKVVTDLIKNNGKNNIKELNKLVVDTINIDEYFKKCIFENLIIT